MRKTFLIIAILIVTKPFLFSQISNEQVYKFNRVMDLISMFYVDTIQENKLVEKAIISVLKDLDPHSIYVNKDEARELNEPLLGSFEGIGITYNILHDTICIISTHLGGPSDRLGIKPGDRIISIDNQLVAGIGINADDVKKRLLGNQGSNVLLRVKPYGKSLISDYSIPREQIPINSIDAAYQVDQKTAYIKLNKFSANSLEEFVNAAKKLKKNGAENLIFDLRDNGGGYLKAATDIADHFLSDKKLIVYTMGMSNPKSEYFANVKGLFENGKAVFLINEGTASASEIVCGAIQDWDRGVLIGRRSFGKGLVQRPFSLLDGSMIRLTIARYYTPSGRLIQKPYSDGYESYSNDIKKRLNHGEMYHPDSIQFADSLKFITLKNNRFVYGGGGIMPDVFVPLDTTMYPKYYQRLMKNGKLYTYVLDFIDKDRLHFNQSYPRFNVFKEKFKIDDDFVKKLMKFAFMDNIQSKLSDDELLAVKINTAFDLSEKQTDYDINNIHVKNHLKALIAQNLYGNNEYYEILNNSDQVFLKALEIINNENVYQNILCAK